MSDDGADLGLSAEDGMRAALGADAEPKQRTRQEMRAEIENNRGRSGYGQTANEACWRILRTFEERPETADWPAERKGHFERPNDLADLGRFIYDDDRDLYAAVKETTDGIGDITMSDLGLTGFQWGWAVNAAKYIVGEPPVPNPAILTIG